MWPYTQEENEMLSTQRKPKPDDNMDPMDWAEVYGHENYRKGLEK